MPDTEILPMPEAPQALAAPANDLPRFEQGRQFYDAIGRPMDATDLTDAEFMGGWFHQWGFTDALSHTPPLFAEVNPMTCYTEGYGEGMRLEVAAQSVQNVADAAFEQYCESQGWDAAYIQEHCRAAEEFQCDRDSLTLFYATLNLIPVDESGADDEADFDAGINLDTESSKLTILEPSLAFSVKFRREDEVFVLVECLDYLADPEKEPIPWAVDVSLLPEPGADSEHEIPALE